MKRALAIAVTLGLAACRSGSNVAPPVPAPPTEAKAADAGTPGVPRLRVLLDDPRLSPARELERKKDWAGAVRALRDARPAELPPKEACAWDYLEGRLALSGEALAEAAAAFERASAEACALSGYARLRAAQALARAGRADEAIARARAVPDAIAAHDEAKGVLAEALSAKGERAAALPLWRESLAKHPHGARWVDTTVRVATALLDGLDGAAEERAREAFDLATKVLLEAPKLAESAGAVAARTRALALLRARDASAKADLTEAERARQAQAWLDTGEPARAYDLASAVLAATKTGPVACGAALTRANAAPSKAVKADAWADAVAACEKEDRLVSALYSGAKARAGRDPKGALEWFSRIEKTFPKHRLADDARFRSALLVAEGSEEDREARAEEMLRTLPDAYPAGDMKTEALFRVALANMRRGEWEQAKPHLDRIVELAPDDRHWVTAARAEYFRARAAEKTGDAEGARARYARIVDRHPLAFYMLLAHARLAEADAAGAERALRERARKDAEGTFPGKAHAVLASPGMVRAMRLLEVGEVDAARREVFASGALADDVDPEVVWTVGSLYVQAGAPELGHVFSRSRLTDHLEHYPEGPWRFRWEVAYPRAFEPLVVKACGEHAVPTTLAWAIMREESSFVADAKSPSNAFGLMQLIVPTAKWMAAGTGFGFDEASLKQPEVSVALGVKLLGKLRATHGHPALAIAAYNGGGGAVGRWVAAKKTEDLGLFVELIPWDETRNYVKRVLSSQAAYAYLYDPTSLKEPLGLPLGLPR